jgi:hypothetical protein
MTYLFWNAENVPLFEKEGPFHVYREGHWATVNHPVANDILYFKTNSHAMETYIIRSVLRDKVMIEYIGKTLLPLVNVDVEFG